MKKFYSFLSLILICTISINAETYLISNEAIEPGTPISHNERWFTVGENAFPDFNSLLANAEENSTIYVADGSFPENITITTNGLTFLGNNAFCDWTVTRKAESTITSTIYIKASNVTINGFKVTGNGRIESSSATNASPLSGIKVIYNYFTGMNIGRSAHKPLVELGDMKTNATANTLSSQCRYKNCEVSHNHFEGDASHLANCISIGGAFGTTIVTDNYFYDGGTSVYFANAQGLLNIKNNVFKNVGKTSYTTLTDKYKGEFCIAIYRSGFANSTTANIIANEFDGCYGQGTAFPLIRIFPGGIGSDSEVQPVNFRVNVNENTFKNKTSVTPPAANDQLGEKLLLFCDNSDAGNKVKFNISNNHFDNRFYKFAYVTLDDGLGAREIYADQFSRFYHACITSNKMSSWTSSLTGTDVGNHVLSLALDDVTVLQSFDIDPLTGDLYFSQIMPTARNNNYNNLHGLPSNHDGIVITRVPCTSKNGYNYTYSTNIESMEIGYGGHGTNICTVRDKNGELWIWGGGNATVNDNNDKSATTARFKFQNGTDLNLNVSKDTEKVKIFNVSGAGNEYPACDETSRLLCVYTTTTDVHSYSIYDLDDALEGKQTLLKKVNLNVGDYARSTITNDKGYATWYIQGFDINGDHLYIYEGTPKGEEGNINATDPTIVITCYNWRTNTYVYRAMVYDNRLNNFPYGEPEGIVIRPDEYGHACLYFAVVNGNAGSRKVNIYKHIIDYHTDYDETTQSATYIGNSTETTAHFKGDYPTMNYSCDTKSLYFATETIDGSDSKTITINNGEYIFGEWCGVITGEDGEAFNVTVDDNNAFSPTTSATVTFKPNIYKSTKRTYNATLRLFSPLASSNVESNDIVIPLTATYDGPLAYGMKPQITTEQVTQSIDDEIYYSFNLALNAKLPEPYDNAYLAYTNGNTAEVLPFRELIDKYVVVMEDATSNFESTNLLSNKATHITIGNENALEGSDWASMLSSKNIDNSYTKEGYGTTPQGNFINQITITNGIEVSQANASNGKAEGASHYSNYADLYSKPLVLHNVDPSKSYNFRLYLSKSSADKMDAWEALYLDHADAISKTMFIPSSSLAFSDAMIISDEEEYNDNTDAIDMPMGSHNTITNEGALLSDPIHYRSVNKIISDGAFSTLYVTSEVVDYWDINYDINLSGDINVSYDNNIMNRYMNSEGLLKGISTKLSYLPVKFATTDVIAEDGRIQHEPIDATQTYNATVKVDYTRQANNSIPETTVEGIALENEYQFKNSPIFTGLTLSGDNIVAKLWEQNSGHLIYGSWDDKVDDYHRYYYDAFMQLNWDDDIDLNHGIGVYASGLGCVGHNNINVAPTEILSDSWIAQYGQAATSTINSIGYIDYDGSYCNENNWSEIAAQKCSLPIKVHYVWGGDNKITSDETATIPVTLTTNYPILVKSAPTLYIGGENATATSLIATDAPSQWIDVVTVPTKTTVSVAGKDIITGVGNILVDNNNLFIYPNPANDYVNVNATVNLHNIEIYSIYGQLLISEIVDTNNIKIDVSNLPSGTYILRAANQSALLIKR